MSNRNRLKRHNQLKDGQETSNPKRLCADQPDFFAKQDFEGLPDLPKVDEHHSNNLNKKENKSGIQSDQHKEIQICSSGSKHGSSDFKIENNLSLNMHSEFSTGISSVGRVASEVADLEVIHPHLDLVDDPGLEGFCHVCQKDISSYNSQRRLQHVNRCIDEVENKDKSKKAVDAALEALKNMVLDCPICGKSLKTINSRRSHLKKCAQTYDISVPTLKDLIDKQENEHRIKIENMQSPEKQNLVTTKVVVKKKQKSAQRLRLEEPISKFDEDTHLAIALSTSMDSEKRQSCAEFAALPNVQSCRGQTSAHDDDTGGKDAFTMMMTAAVKSQGTTIVEPKGRHKKKKQDLNQLPLVMSDQDEVKKLLEHKAALLVSKKTDLNSKLSSEFNVSSQAPFPTSRLKSKYSDKVDLWHADSSKKQLCSYYVKTLTPVMAPAKFQQTVETMSNSTVINNCEISYNSPCASLFTKSQDMPADESYLVGTTQTAFLLAELGADDGNETSIYASQDRRQSTRSAECLLSSLEMMINNPVASDLTLVTRDGSTIHAHKFIIAARCPHLLKIVDSNNKIILEAYSESSVTSLLRYLYCADLSVPQTVVLEAMNLSSWLGLTEFSLICEDIIKSNNIKPAQWDNVIVDQEEDVLFPDWSTTDAGGMEIFSSEKMETSSIEDLHEDEIEELYEHMMTQKRGKILKKIEDESEESSDDDSKTDEASIRDANDSINNTKNEYRSLSQALLSKLNETFMSSNYGLVVDQIVSRNCEPTQVPEPMEAAEGMIEDVNLRGKQDVPSCSKDATRLPRHDSNLSDSVFKSAANSDCEDENDFNAPNKTVNSVSLDAVPIIDTQHNRPETSNPSSCHILEISDDEVDDLFSDKELEDLKEECNGDNTAKLNDVKELNDVEELSTSSRSDSPDLFPPTPPSKYSSQSTFRISRSMDLVKCGKTENKNLSKSVADLEQRSSDSKNSCITGMVGEVCEVAIDDNSVDGFANDLDDEICRQAEMEFENGDVHHFDNYTTPFQNLSQKLTVHDDSYLASERKESLSKDRIFPDIPQRRLLSTSPQSPVERRVQTDSLVDQHADEEIDDYCVKNWKQNFNKNLSSPLISKNLNSVSRCESRCEPNSVEVILLDDESSNSQSPQSDLMNRTDGCARKDVSGDIGNNETKNSDRCSTRFSSSPAGNRSESEPQMDACDVWEGFEDDYLPSLSPVSTPFEPHSNSEIVKKHDDSLPISSKSYTAIKSPSIAYKSPSVAYKSPSVTYKTSSVAYKSPTHTHLDAEVDLTFSPPTDMETDVSALMEEIANNSSIYKSDISFGTNTEDIKLPQKVKKTPTTRARRTSDDTITPLPAYQSMVTPALKQQCKKFGVRVLPKKKMVQVLENIYYETHPDVNPVQPLNEKAKKNKSKTKSTVASVPAKAQNDILSTEAQNKELNKVPRSKNFNFKKKSGAQTALADTGAKQGTITDFAAQPGTSTISTAKQGTIGDYAAQPGTSTISTAKQRTSKHCLHELSSSELSEDDDKSFDSQEDIPVPEESINLARKDKKSSKLDDDQKKEALGRFFHDCSNRFLKILHYEPFELDELVQQLKTDQLKISKEFLIEFMDEHNILFSTRNANGGRNRHRPVEKKKDKKKLPDVPNQETEMDYFVPSP